jgi:hypothetical protein
MEEEEEEGRDGKTNVDEEVSGTVRMFFAEDEERVVSVACVPAGRAFGFGRRVDGGMVMVREDAAVVAAWRSGRKRKRWLAEGNMATGLSWRCSWLLMRCG